MTRRHGSKNHSKTFTHFPSTRSPHPRPFINSGATSVYFSFTAVPQMEQPTAFLLFLPERWTLAHLILLTSYLYPSNPPGKIAVENGRGKNPYWEKYLPKSCCILIIGFSFFIHKQGWMDSHDGIEIFIFHLFIFFFSGVLKGKLHFPLLSFK